MPGVSCFVRFQEKGCPQEGDLIKLPNEEAHHVVRVLRLKVGDSLEVFDGEGRSWNASLELVDKRAVQLRLGPCVCHERSGPIRVLAQAIPKGKTLEGLIRHVTEIGIDVLIPLITDHSEVRLDEDRGVKKLERWESIAVEACKQSKNHFLPKIHAPVKLRDWLSGLDDDDTLRLIGSLEVGADWAASVLEARLLGRDKVCWLIGPEGDFSKEEYAMAREKGFLSVKLARHVLRVETAALYAWSITDATINRES